MSKLNGQATEAAISLLDGASDRLGKCLIVGANGFVGAALCRVLKEHQIEFRALGRRKPENLSADTDWVVCDLKDTQTHANSILSGVDTVFYLASIAHSHASDEEYHQVNVTLCEQFAALAIAYNVKRFVYLSSTKAMQDCGDQICDESYDQLPQDSYGRSKRKIESILLTMAFEHLVILRPCLIYGPAIKGNLRSMIKLIDAGLFPSFSGINNRRSMISVKDVIRAMIAVALTKSAHREIYLLSDGHDYSTYHIENAIRKILGKSNGIRYPLKLLQAFARMGDMMVPLIGRFPLTTNSLEKLVGDACFSNHKILTQIGFRCIDSFDDVLPEIIAEYKKQ